MANASKLSLTEPVRCMLVGYPGAGKTGSLAALANAGFKLRVLDFDGNLKPLLQYTSKEALGNIDILSFEDKTKAGPQYIVNDGIPSAFFNALKAMDRWSYKEDNGTEVDLGSSKDWGPDTVVVLDSLTSMGEAAKRRAMHVMNKTPLNMTDGVWGLAMKEQEAFVERLTSPTNRHHVIVLAHLKMIAPRDVRKGDSELAMRLKEQVADMIQTRYYPSALGWQLPQFIGAHFPTIVLAETRYKGTTPRRVLCYQPREELDLKLPALGLPHELDVGDGMLKIFDALGAKPAA